jgi:hypothetical protein
MRVFGKKGLPAVIVGESFFPLLYGAFGHLMWYTIRPIQIHLVSRSQAANGTDGDAQPRVYQIMSFLFLLESTGKKMACFGRNRSAGIGSRVF